MSEEKEKKPFYKRWWFIVLAILIVIAGVSGGGDESKKSTSTSSKSTSNQSSEPETKKSVPKIGDTISTEYFEVTVNNASESLGPLCPDLCDGPGQGNKFLVLDVTLLNTDNEGRMLTDSGTLFIQYKGKEMTFDDSEIVFADGWLGFSDTLNPMVTVTGKIAFKISTAFVLNEFTYQAPRSDKRIALIK